MTEKFPKKTILSASAQSVAELVERISSGNQREFARAVGCAQPVISRIVNGKQEPGRELLEKIAGLEGVDRAALLATLKSETPNSHVSETMVPIAHCLLDGHPATRWDQLTTSTVAVSPSVFRPSLYAVAARSCQPACSDPSERMRPDDLIIIESSLDRLKKNLQILNGKLCVVVIRGDDGDTITLRRVWVTFDTTKTRWSVRTCPDAKVDKFRHVKYGGKQLRLIQLDLPESLPEPDYVDHLVNVNDIAGVAIELVRNL